MSAIREAVDKIDRMFEKTKAMEASFPSVAALYQHDLKELKDILTDKTVLFLEWNEQDIQRVARERIAHIEDVEDCEIVENPLPREDVEIVISILEKQYDCNYGITWEHLAFAMDYIKLPSLSECIKKTGDE